jgi:DNA-binding response OmpR family regulator
MRILLVEDDHDLSEVVREGLIDEGHAVDLCGTVRDADLASHDNAYDVVVLDVGLPDGDGIGLCRLLRERGCEARILMLTARDSLNDTVAALDAGADDYLTKPFDLPELTARVRALLRRPPRGGSPVLLVGDVKLDPAAQRVWRGAITIPLTTREFALLHYLMAHTGEVVSREELLEHVWDMNYEGGSNVVDAHVANLRRKLDLPDSPASIETVRGVGFRIGGEAQ